MQVREIMTETPACCTPDTDLQAVARLMIENDCGEIPVVESQGSGRLVGVVTDRDITCRTVAEGRNPLQMTARDCMSSPVITVSAESSVEECCHTMEENQIRRIPVVDASDQCCGIVSQADIAQSAPEEEIAEVVREISQPTGTSSLMG